MCGCVNSMDEDTTPHQLTPLNCKHWIQFMKIKERKVHVTRHVKIYHLEESLKVNLEVTKMNQLKLWYQYLQEE